MDRLTWENFPQLDRRLVELDHQLGGLGSEDRHTEIAATLTAEYGSEMARAFTGDQIRNRLKRVRFAQLEDAPSMVLMPNFLRHEAAIKGAAPAKAVAGGTVQEYLQAMLTGRKKTLVMSDLHIPTQDERAIQTAVNRNLTADLIVINGDLLDLYGISSFIKMKDLPVYLELDGGVRFLEYLSTLFPDKLILLTSGNHEDRVYKRIAPVLPAGLEFMTKLDLLEVLSRPFPNVVSVADWFVAVGDAVYAHGDAASVTPGKPARDAGEWFLNHAVQLGIRRPRFVAQAHTHRVSVLYSDGSDTKFVESGCLCSVQDYAHTLRHRNPQVQGYVTVIQQDGVTDLANSRENVLLTSERPVAA